MDQSRKLLKIFRTRLHVEKCTFLSDRRVDTTSVKPLKGLSTPSGTKAHNVNIFLGRIGVGFKVGLEVG
jgi:hypothetical protein